MSAVQKAELTFYSGKESAASEALEAALAKASGVEKALGLRLKAKLLKNGAKGKEAAELLEGEISKASGDAAAVLKVGYAEVCCEMETEKAAAYASEALSALKGGSDKTMLGYALAASASCTMKTKGDKRKNAEDAKTAVTEAVTIFQGANDSLGQGMALHCMACARFLSGAAEGAIRAGKEAIALFQKLNLRKLEATESASIASWYLADGDAEEALACAEEAMELYQESPMADPGEAVLLETVVAAYLKKNQPKTALRAIKDTLERFEESGNLLGEASCYNQMCDAYLYLGDVEKGLRAATNASDTYAVLGDTMNQAKQLRAVCKLHSLVGANDKALRAAQEALEIFETLEDAKEQALTLQMRASVYLAKDETSSALRCSKEARDLFQDAKEQGGEAESLIQLAETYVKMEDMEGALKCAQEAQGIAAEAADAKAEAKALQAQTDIHVAQDELDGAIRTAEKAVINFRDLDEKGEEVQTMVNLIQIRIMLLVRKDKEGKATAKSILDGSQKVLKLAKEALATAKKEGDRQVLGAALYAMTQVHLMMGQTKEGLKSADEAQMIFLETGDEKYEAMSLMLQANLLLHSQDFNEARMKAEESIYVLQKIGDSRGEEQGWEVIDSIERVEAERREAEQQAQLLQWQQQQAWMQAQQGGGLVMTPLPQQTEAPAAEASQAGGGYEAKLVKLDTSSVLEMGTVKTQITEITKGIIGYDDDIEADMPLMESGLTSNTAVLLRDALVQQLPGIPLPVTLIFDYPSIASMGELIVETSEKQAKKAAKAALK